jgi:hypothetical protein
MYNVAVPETHHSRNLILYCMIYRILVNDITGVKIFTTVFINIRQFIIVCTYSSNPWTLYIMPPTNYYAELPIVVLHETTIVILFHYLVHGTCFCLLLTPWCRTLFEKSSLSCQKISCILYGTRRFITVFTRARHPTLS